MTEYSKKGWNLGRLPKNKALIEKEKLKFTLGHKYLIFGFFFLWDLEMKTLKGKESVINMEK